MKNITPHLWFDKEAREAAEFYTDLFPDSKITNVTTLHDTPSGDSDSVSFMLAGQPFMAISAGPVFKLNPAISFFLNFDPATMPNARQELDRVWELLSDGGQALMPLQEYDFSQHYGWIQDKFGVSWQLILANPEGEKRPFIVPSLLFTQDVNGQAEEAVNFYLSVFPDSKLGSLNRSPEGTLLYTDFKLFDSWLAAMDGGMDHSFTFNEAVSLMVPCDTQQEIDYFWEKLSADPAVEQCGWLKDKYGVSWQIVPTVLNEMMSQGSVEQIDRVTQTLLPMKKLDIAALKAAYEQ